MNDTTLSCDCGTGFFELSVVSDVSFSKSSVYESDSLGLFSASVSVFLSSAVSGLGAVSVSVSDFVLSLSVDHVVVSSVDVL